MTTCVKLADNFYYDGCACYNEKGDCVCAECFYNGTDRVNCAYVSDDYAKCDKYVFDTTTKKFIKADTKK